MGNIVAQTELLDTDHSVFTGDFNIDLLKTGVSSPQVFKNYFQAVNKPTTANNTLIDHIYIKSKQQTDYDYNVLPTYYSYHRPVFIAINI